MEPQPQSTNRIARKALHLQQLGLSRLAISKMLAVTDKTVAKAIVWLGKGRKWYKL